VGTSCANSPRRVRSPSGDLRRLPIGSRLDDRYVGESVIESIATPVEWDED